MTIMDDFLDWEEKYKGEIQNVKELLARQLANEPETLVDDLAQIEAHNGRIGVLLSEANYYLDLAKAHFLPSRDTGTELDRRTQLDKDTASIRCVRDTLESLSDSIRQRLICAESMLSYMRVYADHVKREPGRPF